MGVEYTGPELETYKLRMSFKGTVSRDFLHFFAEKIRPRPTMNREKTVSRIYSIAKFENQVSACQISSKIFLYIRTFSYF